MLNNRCPFPFRSHLISPFFSHRRIVSMEVFKTFAASKTDASCSLLALPSIMLKYLSSNHCVCKGHFRLIHALARFKIFNHGTSALYCHHSIAYAAEHDSGGSSHRGGSDLQNPQTEGHGVGACGKSRLGRLVFRAKIIIEADCFFRRIGNTTRQNDIRDDN